jgi:hypothetical protein
MKWVGSCLRESLFLNDVRGDLNNRITITRNGNQRPHPRRAAMVTGGWGVQQIDHHTIEIPLAAIAGSIGSIRLGGNDILTVDYTGGPLPDIHYNGGTGGFDGLVVIGDASQSATYTPDRLITGKGQVVTSAGSVFFSELEPVDITGFGTATLDLPGGDDVLDHRQMASTICPAERTRRSASPEPAAACPSNQPRFWNNTTVVIDTTGVDGDDTITSLRATTPTAIRT